MSTKHILFYGSCIYVALVCAVALLPQLFSTQTPTAIDLAGEYALPSALHLFGQGENGVDLWAQVIHGARISLAVSVCVVAVALTIGTLLGTLGGYLGGWVDRVITGLVDVVFAFPGTLLAIALAAVLGPSLFNVIFLLSITGWPPICRLVRGETLRLKNLEFVHAVECLGGSLPRILFKHLLPNLWPLLLVQASFSMASAILVESSLSFLGLGVPPGTPTWGGLLSMGKNAMLYAWHVSVIPGIVLMLLILSFNLIGDGLRDRWDPRHRLIPAR